MTSDASWDAYATRKPRKSATFAFDTKMSKWIEANVDDDDIVPTAPPLVSLASASSTVAQVKGAATHISAQARGAATIGRNAASQAATQAQSAASQAITHFSSSASIGLKMKTTASWLINHSM